MAKRYQITLGDGDAAKIEEIAERRGSPASTIIREAAIHALFYCEHTKSLNFGVERKRDATAVELSPENAQDKAETHVAGAKQ